MKSVYTTYDISKFLSVDITTVMVWIDQGKINAYKTPGGHRRVLHDDFLEFLQKHNMPVPKEIGKKTKNILIIEDELHVIRLISRLMRRVDEQIQIESAVDGFEAGRKLETFSPDLIILDLNLPGIDGFRVCQQIRSNHKLKTIKILAISGNDSEERKKKILHCGADEFMGKPFEVDPFLELVKKLLGSGRAA